MKFQISSKCHCQLTRQKSFSSGCESAARDRFLIMGSKKNLTRKKWIWLQRSFRTPADTLWVGHSYRSIWTIKLLNSNSLLANNLKRKDDPRLAQLILKCEVYVKSCWTEIQISWIFRKLPKLCFHGAWTQCQYWNSLGLEILSQNSTEGNESVPQVVERSDQLRDLKSYGSNRICLNLWKQYWAWSIYSHLKTFGVDILKD